MSVSPDYRPKLPDAYLREEHSYFVEAGFEAVVYGITFTFYVFTLHALYKRRHLSHRRRTRSPPSPTTHPRSLLSRLITKHLPFLSPLRTFRSRAPSPSAPLVVFLTLHHLTLLLAVALNIDYIARSFVYNRRIPGGPVVYQQRYGTLPGAYAALGGWMGGAWGQGGMALYRCFTIWGDTPVVWFTVPIFMYGISVALSTLLLLRLPHPTLLPALATPLGIPLPLFYFGLNVCFTCVVSGLITFRLLRHRRALAGSVGAYYYAARDITEQRQRRTTAPRRARAQAERATSALAILTDSALPYALVGIVQVVSMGTDAAVATGVEGLYGAMAVGSCSYRKIVFGLSVAVSLLWFCIHWGLRGSCVAGRRYPFRARSIDNPFFFIIPRFALP
ncbi:hypothetical protein JB92DRAFT_1959559 [Gautieria morchelliformis]|nr:hypothetical protein JB92DRAFT_1959559 [Gautieria morchelliformis]